MIAATDHAAFISAVEAEATGTTSPLKRALRRVLEEPDNDFNRGVYADRLDDVGEHERAEFIRVQCELAQFEKTQASRPIPCPENAMMYELAKRSRYLIRNNWDDWFPWAKPRSGHTFRSGVCTLEVLDGDGKHLGLETSSGSIGRLECTLAQFMGGDCTRCRGRGRLWVGGYENRSTPIVQADEFESCKPCQGTGKLPGLVELFAVEPVVAVNIVGTEPYQTSSNDFSWSLHQIGASLYVQLCNAFYPTSEAALAALGRECVNIGRRRAGLRPLAVLP